MIMSHPPEWVKRFTKPRTLRVIASIASLAEGLDGALEAAITHERQLEKGTRRTLGTIHKAKGPEFPNVLIWNFSNADFPITDQAGVPGRGVRAGRKHQLARDYGGDSVQVVIADGLESFELHVAPL